MGAGMGNWEGRGDGGRVNTGIIDS
jgi:hypothetical protein